MSQPPRGLYYIVSYATGNLALNYNGQNNPEVTVVQYSQGSVNQVWAIQSEGPVQTVSPVNAQNLQITPENDTLVTVGSSYGWEITQNGKLITVQDPASGLYWTLQENPGVGSPVNLSEGNNSPLQQWILFPTYP